MKKIGLIIGVLVLVGGLFTGPAQQALAAACVNTSGLGSVSGTFTLPYSPNGTTYRIWSRIASDPADNTHNSYDLEIDGNSCFQNIGGSTSIPSTFQNSSANWVDYMNGVTTQKASMVLGPGQHSYIAYGRGANVMLDRVVFSANSSCTPTGTGDNCAIAPSDVTKPTVSITSPAAGTVSNTVNITASASDDSGTVASVSYYLDNSTTALATVTTSPYTYAWPTATVSNTSHTISAVSKDTTGNTSNPSTVTVTVSNTTVDTTAATSSITAPTNNQTVSGTIPINVSASDNVGVTRVDLYVDGSLVANDPASPYTFSWNTTTYENKTHTLQTKAYDAAGNAPQFSPTITVTTSNVSSKVGDINNDTVVSIKDLSILLTHWNQTGQTTTSGDLNGGGVVNISDLSILLSHWGT